MDSQVHCELFFTVYLAESTDIYWAKYIKENSNSKVIFMGPETSSRPKEFLKVSDMVIVGEPEEVIKKPTKGIVYGGLIQNLDDLPFPARHLIKDPYKYFNPKLKGRPVTTMLTSRNCFGRCIYCIPGAYCFAREIGYKKINKRKPPVGLRSPENIYEEFKLIKEQGYKAVAIMDDNFVNGVERTNKICKLIKQLNMEWGCLARADVLQDEDMLRNMKEAGCRYIDMGVESFNQKALDYMKKDIKAGDILNAILLLQKVGIEPKINILLGIYPYDTKEEIDWMLNILKKLDIKYVSFGVVIPHPETEFYKIVKENGWFATKSGDFEKVDPYREATVDFPVLSLIHQNLGHI